MGEPRVGRWRLASSLAGRGGGAEGDGDGSSFTHVGAGHHGIRALQSRHHDIMS